MSKPVLTSSATGYRFIIVLAIALMANACSQKRPEAGDEKQPGTQIAPASDIKSGDSASGQRFNFDQGIAALSVRDYDQARRIFTEIIRTNPALSGPYANLALINFKQGKFELALNQINRALEINPLQSQAYHLRAQIQLQNGEIKKARDDYQTAIDLNPEYLNAHYNLALLYDIYLQEIALAIEHYKIYLSLLGKPDETMEEWINHLKGTLENG